MVGVDRGAFLGLLALGARRPGSPPLRALAGAVRGPVIASGSAGYDAARLVYDQRYDDVRPLAVVQPLGPADVRAAVLWAQRYGVRPAARSGGHSYGGYSTTTGVVVDLARLAAIALDARAGTATIGAGARLIDVYATLAARGVTIAGGSCASVGIGGLTLGGGVGLASRAFGTASDNVVSLRIVTADGRIRTCDARTNRDLFWACRGGGGGNFGIVTDFTFRVHPVSTVSYYFSSWPWSQATQVVQAWQAFAPHAPDWLFSLCTLGTGATPRVGSFGQFLGPETQLRAVLAPLERVAGAHLTTGTSSFLDAQLRWAGCLGKTIPQCHLAGESPGGTLQRASFAAKSDYVTTPFPAAALATIEQWVERAQTGIGSGSILLDAYGGALNRVPADATAFVHRDALFSCQYLTYWRGGSGAANLGWIRGFYGAMRPYASGFAYQNYIDPELAGWRHAYYGANYSRLRAVKRRIDPDGLFRFRQAI